VLSEPGHGVVAPEATGVGVRMHAHGDRPPLNRPRPLHGTAWTIVHLNTTAVRNLECPPGRQVLEGVDGVPSPPGSDLASTKEPTMADKSPRQHMSKKAGKSIKEKRAEKHAKAAAKSKIEIVPPHHK
jgi:hypothetical protein